MRVLFISNYYPPYEVGGYEQLCRDVVEQFKARGYQVEVLTSNRGVTKDTVPLPGVRRVLRLQLDFASRLSPVLQFLLVRRAAHRHNLSCFTELVRALKPDVVFIWNLQGLPISIAVAAEDLPGVTVTYWLAGYTPAEPDDYERYWLVSPKKRTFLHWLKKWIAQLALTQMQSEGRPRPVMHHVAVVSEFIRRKGLAEGVLPEHTSVIYNGVEVEQFFQPVIQKVDGPFKLLLAGRVSADKGIHTAIAALAYLYVQEKLTDIHLTIAGSGPADYLAKLRTQVANQAIEKQVTFSDWLPREQMPGLMQQHHGLLLPTEHPEPFARVVLEAMAAGLVVVAALTGGTSEIVRENETGLTFPSGDSSALAKQIQCLYDDAALRYRIAQAGQALVCEQFSLSRMVDNLETFLYRAIQEDRKL